MLKDHFSPALVPYVEKELACMENLFLSVKQHTIQGNHYLARKRYYDILKSLEQITMYAEEKQYHDTAVHYLNAIHEEEARRNQLAIEQGYAETRW